MPGITKEAIDKFILDLNDSFINVTTEKSIPNENELFLAEYF
jgi:hypothetical protein